MATITPKEFAAKVGSDGRTVRKFLRSDAGMGMRVGKGQRWEIESRQVKALTKKFNAWNATRNENANANSNDANEITENE
jgi:hypothetical protein